MSCFKSRAGPVYSVLKKNTLTEYAFYARNKLVCAVGILSY